MRNFHRRFASTSLAVTVASALITFAPEARANSGLAGLDAVVTTIVTAGVLGVATVIVSFPDLAYATGGERQPKPLAIAKIALCAPQALFYDGFTVYATHSSGDQEAAAVTTFMGAWTGAMTTSGIWSLADDIDPASLYGISWAIGANAAFTSFAIGDLFGDRNERKRGVAIAEMISMVPTLAVSAVRLTDPTAARPAWGALAGWSGLLFVHGLVATVSKQKPSTPPESPTKETARPWMHFGPTLVTDGTRQVPGLMFAGIF